VGVKRQAGGSRGEIIYRYPLINETKILFMDRLVFMVGSLEGVMLLDCKQLLLD
jgi:hypothetical protein